jgi:hypothetical protein
MSGQEIGGAVVVAVGVGMILARLRIAPYLGRSQLGWIKRLFGGEERLIHVTERSLIPVGIGVVAFGNLLIFAPPN